MLKKERKYILKWAKKIKAIRYLGSKCCYCEEDNIHALDFHHKNPKEKKFQITLVGLHKKWSSIEKEIKKCILLCCNCHIKEHRKNRTTQSLRRIKIKQQMLEYKGSFQCSKCGTEDLTGTTLDFHHIREKEIGIGDLIGRSTGYHSKRQFSLTERILKELDKCIILCHNCHVITHTNLILYDKLKKEIYNKIESMQENHRLDVDKIMLLKSQGLSPQKIANQLCYKKSSVEYHIYHKK